MSQVVKQLTELIGNTPLLQLEKYSAEKGLETPVIVKIEFFNPGGSVKDRIALAMIEDAEKKASSSQVPPSSNQPAVTQA